YRYDARNNSRFTTDPEDFVTEQVYDGLDRRIATIRPEGIRVDYGYDKSSRLLTYTDALENVTRYDYDVLDRRIRTTWEGETVESLAYDNSHNVVERTDPNGTVISQSYDPARRLSSREVVPVEGVAGADSESYGYDGLYRTTVARSGDVETLLTYDSLSRLLSDTTSGRTVNYEYDDWNNLIGVGYPSGHKVKQVFDGLNRPAEISFQPPGAPEDAIEGAATYSYRGPFLEAGKSLRGGLTGRRTFDPARRLLDDILVNQSGQTIFEESFSWSPRSLKVAQSRGDRNDLGEVLAHDGARRLLHAADLSNPTEFVGNNEVPATESLAELSEVSSFQYDAAENLLSQTHVASNVPELVELPLDGSGRNRPGAAGGQALEYDANGNLVRKGNRRYHYDFRNRLIRVTTMEGDVIAEYSYDTFNRRVEKTIAGRTEETVWGGWRALEQYDEGQLRSRRTYGRGLDEVVVLETDLNGDGALTEYVPIYDETGNFTMITHEAKPVERYEYTPYGEQTILGDLTPPAVEQVRVKKGELWIEVSEAILEKALQEALDDGTLTLSDLDADQEVPIAVSLPVVTGRQAHRRAVISLPGPPAAGTNLQLTLPAGSLIDEFFNVALSDFQIQFTWSLADPVVLDETPPQLERILLLEGILELEFSEEPDIATAEAILVDGDPVDWILDETRYRLRTASVLGEGVHEIAVTNGLSDLAGRHLESEYQSPFEVSPLVPNLLVFDAGDARYLTTSALLNTLGFHGLEHDSETGFVYMRNRYYDPDLGRFISADPLGYVDGPSSYQFALNSPFGNRDPTGTVTILIHGVHSTGSWFGRADVGLRVYEKDTGTGHQEVIHFTWGDPDVNGKPHQGGSLKNATSSVDEMYLSGHLKFDRSYMTTAVDRLVDILNRLNEEKTRLGSTEPINIIAHSQGSIIALAALARGGEVDNIVIMGSPLNIWRPYDHSDLTNAQGSIRGQLFNYWSKGDEMAMLKSGIGRHGNRLAKEPGLEWVVNRQFGPGQDIHGYRLPSDDEFDEYDHSDYMALAAFFANIHSRDIEQLGDRQLTNHRLLMRDIKGQASWVAIQP
ncbi:MAG: RHS repeat-associated core domain-containing protein, partial [Thermoanaerobaculia bacterium]